MEDDDWVKSALMDDFLVVEILSRLKNSPADPFYSQSWIPDRPPKPVLLPLGWGHRQLRSKPVTAKDREPTRCSPTTPLSWSANSLSDGYDDSVAGRSKVFSHLFSSQPLPSQICCHRQLDLISRLPFFSSFRWWRHLSGYRICVVSDFFTVDGTIRGVFSNFWILRSLFVYISTRNILLSFVLLPL